MKITSAQARALSSLLGQYQELLESAITCEQIQTDEGMVDPVHDPAICRRLQRDRRRWRKCEDFQLLLQGDTAHGRNA